MKPDITQTSWAFDWAAASGIVYALFDGRTMTATDAKSNHSRGNFSDLQALFVKADALHQLHKRRYLEISSRS
jgi:hypothetical protein